MAKAKDPDKRTIPIRNHSGRRLHFRPNIGTIVFGIIFIYMLISFFLYITATHVRSFRVTSGPLARNAIYTGVALFDERVVTADTSGYVEYYAGDHSKVKCGGVVYSLSPGQTRQSSMEAPDAATLQLIREDCQMFSQTFSPVDFHDVYSLKYAIEGDLLNEQLSRRLQNGVSSTALTLGNTTVSVSAADGIICYSMDGYENLEPKDFSAAMFDEKSYHLQTLKSEKQVQAGDPIYKIIESEDWSLYIPLTAKQIVKMNNTSQVRVKFLKDGVTQNAEFTILTLDDGSYCGRLDFSSGLIRYIDSRFIDIELVTNSAVGLKIPVSSILAKSFYTIPEEYAAFGGNSSNIGFMKSVTDRSGNVSSVFENVTVYAHKDKRYYVDGTCFKEGDIVTRDGSTDRYIIRDSAILEGVYCMNKGYALFRQIEILDKNEDYCIVAANTDYGISQFDNIVENASSVRDSQITAH